MIAVRDVAGASRTSCATHWGCAGGVFSLEGVERASPAPKASIVHESMSCRISITPRGHCSYILRCQIRRRHLAMDHLGTLSQRVIAHPSISAITKYQLLPYLELSSSSRGGPGMMRIGRESISSGYEGAAISALHLPRMNTFQTW